MKRGDIVRIVPDQYDQERRGIKDVEIGIVVFVPPRGGGVDVEIPPFGANRLWWMLDSQIEKIGECSLD